MQRNLGAAGAVAAAVAAALPFCPAAAAFPAGCVAAAAATLRLAYVCWSAGAPGGTEVPVPYSQFGTPWEAPSTRQVCELRRGFGQGTLEVDTGALTNLYGNRSLVCKP